MSHTTSEDAATYRYAFSTAPIVPAKELKRGDRIHHWSPTGGVWKVEAILRDGRIKMVSDLAAVRYFQPEFIDEKGARLYSRA